MQHRLVPDFILEKAAAGEANGRFRATALFLDVSGFSSIMDALMAHGQHGSEVMAGLMRHLFDPLVDAVYAHGGYIIGFAGDAFTAVFPETTPHQTTRHALSASATIQTHVRANPSYQTEYGEFPISAKVGLAHGEVEWGILHAATRNRATYFYKGETIQGCSDAEHAANSGDIVLHSSIAALLAPHAETIERDGFFVVTAAPPAVPPIDIPRLPNQATDTVSRFFPKSLITQQIPGEFRQIINLFINLQGTPSFNELETFMQTVFLLQDRYGGLLNRIDFGDKGCHLLFFWGAPVSYENDLISVLSFVQDLVERTAWPLRIGVTYRIAHAGFIGSPLHEEYTCYGRGVNLAARFMTAANWHTVWVDEHVADRARTHFRFEFVDELAFKGFGKKQAVYTLLGRRQMAQPPLYEGAMVGRSAELARLEGFVGGLENGRFSGVAIITGEAGIGKSRLVHELLEQAEATATAEHFLAQTDEINQQSLGPFRYWLRTYFEQNATAGERMNKQQFEQTLDLLIEETDDSAAAADLQRSRSFLGALLGLHWPYSLYEQVEPQLRFENTLAGIKTLIKAEAQRQPIVFHLEDAHWMDDDSWACLTRLTRNIDSVSLCIIITSRQPLPADVLTADVPTIQIALDNLPQNATAALVEEQLGEAADGRFLQWLLTRTDGNPFFIEQMLLYLEENDLLTQSNEQFATVATGTLLPTDVRSVLTARLDRLHGAVKEVVQTASVVGREFDSPIVMEMLGNQPEIGRFLQTATDEAIWLMLTQIRYLFKHLLLRDAAYNMQVQSLLKVKHASAASAFETVYATDLAPHYGQIAYHYDQALHSVKALGYYERAADQARQNYQNDDALAQYNRAIALADKNDLETRYRLLLGKEEILNWLGQREAQRTIINALLAIIKEDAFATQQTEVHLRLAALETNTGNYEAALTAAERAVETAVFTQDLLTQARANHRLGRTHWQHNQHATAKPFIEKALAIAKAENNQPFAADCLYDLAAIAYLQNTHAVSLTQLENAYNMYQLLNHKSGIIRCLNLFGLLSAQASSYAKARWYNEQSLEICNEIGWKYGAARITINIGNNLLLLGNYALAQKYHQRAETICLELNDKEGMANSLDSQGLSLLFTNEKEAAAQRFQHSIDIAKTFNLTRSISFAQYHLALCQIEQGAYGLAEQTLHALSQLRYELGQQDGDDIELIAAKAKLLFRQGKGQTAVSLLEQNLEQLNEQTVRQAEFPTLVTADCYPILMQSNLDQCQTLAADLLRAAYQQLQEDAQKIEDEEERTLFLTNVPFNKQLISLYRNMPSIP